MEGAGKMIHSEITVKELTEWVESKLSEPIIYGNYSSAIKDITVKLGWMPKLNKWFVNVWEGGTPINNPILFSNPQDAINEYEKRIR